VLIQVWGLRAFREDSPAGADLRWRPEMAQPVVVPVGIIDLTQEDAENAVRLIRMLLRPHVKTTKQEGAGVEDYPAFIRNVQDALDKVWKKKRALPTEKEAAKVFGLGKSAFHDRLKDHGLSWPRLKAWRPGGPPLIELLGGR
jgi:hypothetical protein